jgi:hypothetical protein
VSLDRIPPALLSELTGRARTELLEALEENPEGTVAVAQSVMRNRTASNPAGLFIHKLRQGAHNAQAKAYAQRTMTQQVIAAVNARVAAHGWEPGDPADCHDAISYAIDYIDGASHHDEAAVRAHFKRPNPAERRSEAIPLDVARTLPPLPSIADQYAYRRGDAA